MGILLVVVTGLAYLGTAILSVAQLYDMKQAKWANFLAWLGFAAQTVWLVWHLDTGAVTLTDWVAFFVWVTVGLYLTLAGRLGLRPVGAFLFPITFLMWLGGQFVPSGRAPAHQGLFPLLHLLLGALGDASFLLAAVFGIMYLEKERELKQKDVHLFYYQLPALDAMDSWMARFLAVGWAFDTVALAAAALTGYDSGLVWSTIPWASLVMWVLYGALLGGRCFGSLRGIRLAQGTMLGFVGVLIVLFGINLIMLGARPTLPAL